MAAEKTSALVHNVYYSIEKSNKGFLTGAVGISLVAKSTGIHWQYAVGDGAKGVFLRSRSITKYGYDKAWNKICEVMWDFEGRKDDIPQAPLIEQAVQYLRSHKKVDESLLTFT